MERVEFSPCREIVANILLCSPILFICGGVLTSPTPLFGSLAVVTRAVFLCSCFGLLLICLAWITADCCLSQRANILKEVQIMRNLDHPNIVKLIDFSESRQYYYIILELCPGGELFHQIVRLTYFSEDLSRHVILQVAKAIEYLHETSGVVHRYVPILPP